MADIITGNAEWAELAGRRFECDAEADLEFSLPGYKNENRPSGSGRLITKKTRKLGNVTLPLVLDEQNGDLEFIQSLADRTESFPIVFGLTSGSVYSGIAQIEDEVSMNTGDGKCDLELKPSSLARQ